MTLAEMSLNTMNGTLMVILYLRRTPRSHMLLMCTMRRLKAMLECVSRAWGARQWQKRTLSSTNKVLSTTSFPSVNSISMDTPSSLKMERFCRAMLLVYQKWTRILQEASSDFELMSSEKLITYRSTYCFKTQSSTFRASVAKLTRRMCDMARSLDKKYS
jgi:hypothetical protein